MNNQITSKPEKEVSKTMPQKVWNIIKRVFGFLLVTILLIAVGLYGVMWVLTKGPSPTAKKLFTLSVKETSAVGFLANLYLSDAEIDEILNGESKETIEETTDSALITLTDPEKTSDTQSTGDEVSNDSYKLPDYAQETVSEDGIQIVKIKGATYKGFMMVIDDPKRVFVGTPETYGADSKGVSLSDMINKNNAVAGINAGGFYDPSGGGNGGIPDGIVICDGKLTWGEKSDKSSVIGFDADGILHVGEMTAQQALDANIKWAVSFGPALVINGTACTGMASGVNPRTAIGQRADGTVLMLVLDGRQVDSLGATFEDLADIMLDFGAVNASNLDGGSSTLLIYKNEILNVCASVYGPRELATAFLVK